MEKTKTKSGGCDKTGSNKQVKESKAKEIRYEEFRKDFPNAVEFSDNHPDVVKEKLWMRNMAKDFLAVKAKSAVFRNLTPALAHVILNDCNTENRRISDDTVNRYAKLMIKDKFAETSYDVILFCVEKKPSGEIEIVLRNGQHRSAAVLKAQKTYEFLFVFCGDKEAFKYLDRGRRRKNSDDMEILQIDNAAIINGIGFELYKYYKIGNEDGIHPNGNLTALLRSKGIEDFVTDVSRDLYHEMGVDIMQTAAQYILAFKSSYKGLGSYSALGASYIILSKLSDKAQSIVDEFFFNVSMRIGTLPTDPTVILRKALDSLYEDSSGRGKRSGATHKCIKIDSKDIYTCIISAWNLWCIGNPRKKTQVSPAIYNKVKTGLQDEEGNDIYQEYRKLPEIYVPK